MARKRKKPSERANGSGGAFLPHRPHGSLWREVRDEKDGLGVELPGEMIGVQFGGALFILFFVGIFVCVFGMMFAESARKVFQSFAEAGFSEWLGIFFYGTFFLPLLIVELFSLAYFSNEFRRAFLCQRWRFSRESALRTRLLLGLRREKRFDLTALERMEVRALRSWFDQFLTDYFWRYELVFLNAEGKTLCRIPKVSEAEARWLAALWRQSAGLSDLPGVGPSVSFRPEPWRVPRSFVCEPERLAANYRYLRWRAWPLLLFLFTWISGWSFGLGVLWPVFRNSPNLSAEFCFPLPFLLWLALAAELFVVGALLYWIFGRERLVLDADGLRYSFSVLIPLFRTTIPFAEIESFAIRSTNFWYDALGLELSCPANQMDRAVFVTCRTRRPLRLLVFSSPEPEIHELEWVKRNGSRLLERLKASERR